QRPELHEVEVACAEQEGKAENDLVGEGQDRHFVQAANVAEGEWFTFANTADDLSEQLHEAERQRNGHPGHDVHASGSSRQFGTLHDQQGEEYEKSHESQGEHPHEEKGQDAAGLQGPIAAETRCFHLQTSIESYLPIIDNIEI